jgi:hypothetical protein
MAHPARPLVLTATVLLALVAPALGVNLGFDPPQATFVGSQNQTVWLTVDGIEDLLGLGLSLTYDPTVVDPTGVVAGPLFDEAPCSSFLDWSIEDGAPGTLVVDLALLGCTVAGPGGLLGVTFEGVASGTTALVVGGTLRDSLGEPIPFEAENGQLTYQAEITSQLGFAPDPAFIDASGNATVCLTLTDVPDFLGMSVSFAFDPLVVFPESVVAGPELESAGCAYFLDWIDEDETTDTVSIDAALLGCSAAIDGPIVCITFTGIDLGQSPLTWLDVDVRASDNEQVPVEAVDGSLVYDEIISTEGTSFSELKARFIDRE